MDLADTIPAERLAYLLELSDALGVLADPGDVCVEAARLLAGQIGASQVLYQEINDNDAAAPQNDWLALLLATCPAERTAIVADVTTAEWSVTERAAWDEHGVSALVAAPVVRHDRIVGILAALQDQPRDWSDEDIAVIEETAGRVSDAVTRTRDAQQARLCHERYRTLVDSMDEGFCVIETLFDERGTCIDYRFMEVNRAFERQTGFTDVVGKRMREIELTHEPFWFEIYGRVALTGKPVRFERQSEQLNRWFDVFAYRVGEAETESRQVGILFNDITQTRRARSALRASEARLTALFDTLPDGIGVTDRAGHLQLRNKQLLRFLPTDLIASREPAARPHWRASDDAGNPISPDDFPVARALRGKPTPPLEMLFTPADGPEVWTRVTSLPMLGSGDEIVGAIVLITDIDALKRSEQALRESKERLRTLADAVSPLIWSRQSDGTATFFNQRWYDYTGLSPAESEEAGWEAIVHPDDAPGNVRDWRRSLAAGKRFECHYRLRGADGSYRWFIGRSVPLKDPDGTVLGWVGSATDVHDLKCAEAQLREADLRKNHFLATLGHELRNPLAAIQNGVALLSSQKARPESREAALPIVAEQVTHVQRLIDDLLDLTRIVEGRMQVHREPMVLQDALEQALQMAQPQAEAESIELSVETDPAPLRLDGDRVRLAQVFLNLIGNALKYSGESRRVEISARRSGDEAVVRIRDFGLGIPRDLRERIFEPFFQAKPGLTLKSGLGLGLSVVRQLVHLHDGAVAVFSGGENGGSEFVVRLPLFPTTP